MVHSAYLESDIFATTSNGEWQGYPANGSFAMRAYVRGNNDITYHRGLTVHTGDDGWVAAPVEARITYDIANRSVTKLTGIFGYTTYSTSGMGIVDHSEGALTVTCAESGRFLGGVGLTSRESPKSVSIDIPPGINKVTIRLFAKTTSVYTTQVGFGDAVFE